MNAAATWAANSAAAPSLPLDDDPPARHDDAFSRKVRDQMDIFGPYCSCLVTLVLGGLILIYLLQRAR